MTKIPDACLKGRNQGVGRDCWEGKKKLGESDGRRLSHTPACGGCHRWEVTRVEPHKILVVARVSAGM